VVVLALWWFCIPWLGLAHTLTHGATSIHRVGIESREGGADENTVRWGSKVADECVQCATLAGLHGFAALGLVWLPLLLAPLWLGRVLLPFWFVFPLGVPPARAPPFPV
jgi:hypothetical protein